jgi:hypothetical protein
MEVTLGPVPDEWLASVPFAFRVDGGQELRAAVATVASRFAASLDPANSTQLPRLDVEHQEKDHHPS